MHDFIYSSWFHQFIEMNTSVLKKIYNPSYIIQTKSLAIYYEAPKASVLSSSSFYNKYNFVLYVIQPMGGNIKLSPLD